MSQTSATGIPPFTDLGVLPTGRHSCSASDIKLALVDRFGVDSIRSVIFAEWKSHRAALRSLGSVEFQWVNGSFVTDKVNPGDIDIVTFFNGPAFDLLPRWKQHVIQELTNGKGSVAYTHVDASLAFFYPKTTRMYDSYKSDRAYWDAKYSRSRDFVAKGYLEVR